MNSHNAWCVCLQWWQRAVLTELSPGIFTSHAHSHAMMSCIMYMCGQTYLRPHAYPPHCPFQCDVILVANAAAIIITGITHWMASSNSSAKLPGQRVLLIRQPTSLAMLVRTPPPSWARQPSTFPCDNICYYHPAQQQSSLISPSLSQHSNNHYQHQLFQRGFWNAIVEKILMLNGGWWWCRGPVSRLLINLDIDLNFFT